MTIKIPSSIQLYFENNAVQTAIDSFKLRIKNKSLEEAVDVYKANLSVEKTKTDFIIFLYEVYKEAVIKTIKELKPEYLNEKYLLASDDIDVDNSEERCFGKCFISNNTRIEFYLYMSNEAEIKLSFSFSRDAKKDLYKVLEETEKYKFDKSEEDEDILYSKPVKIAGEELDVSELKEAVKDFLKII